MIKYKCSKCKKYFIGGVEDTECPICKGKLIFDRVIEKHD